MQLGLNKLPWYGQILLFVVLSGAAAGLFYYLYVVDAVNAIAVQQKQLDGVKAEIARGLATARRLPEFETQVKDLEARLDTLKNVLPEQKDVAELLTRIQTLATQSNLVIRGFKPQAVSQKQAYAEWPISLELDGNYHDLGAFLDKVSKVPRIITVNNIELAAAKEKRDKTALDPHTIEAKCQATTYVLVENPAPDPKQTPAKGRAAASTRPAKAAAK